MGEKINLYRIVVGKHEGKKQVGTPSCRCEGHTRIDVNEMGWQGVYWIYVTRALVHMTKKRLVLE
jgi:hypothetical protein